MKKSLLPIMVLALILIGCGSAKKQMETGNYDAAISKSVEKLRKDREDTKTVDILDQSYRIALEQDNERIRFLKMEGKPENWDAIYLLYKKMSDRQAMVRTVLPLQSGSKTVNFPYVDYMEDMVAAKKNAADFYYAHGQQLLESRTKEGFRQAYYEFIRAKEYAGDYEGIDDLIYETKMLGMSRVFVAIQNNSHINFPPEFESDLLALDLPRLNSEWVEYHTMQLDDEMEFDYVVAVTIKMIGVSPDNTLQRDTLIKREIEDGFQYVLDNNGNVMKDTLGNDLKVKKYKSVQCALIESIQRKECHIEADVGILSTNPQQELKKDPLIADSFFDHISARAIGDVEALLPADRAKINSQPAPFPSDLDMVIRCSEALKAGIRDAMNRNRRFIQ
ncbi:MAG TPA: hypothetical protein VMW76_02940 [Bacteroidales bacterium]|nr:hypothetical protein [Bacteroidales bacterium]